MARLHQHCAGAAARRRLRHRAGIPATPPPRARIEFVRRCMDKRRRNLLILGVTAAVLVLLAAFALYRQEQAAAPASSPETMFPGLAHEVREVAKIHIASQKFGAFDVEFVPEKGWVLPGRGNYP